MRVLPASPEHHAWLEERNHFKAPSDFRAIEVVDDSGFTRAMAGFFYWTPNSVQMSMWADSPASLRALAGPMFSYPFEECGRGVLLAFIPSHSKRVSTIARNAGFREVGRIRDGFAAGDDVVVFEMRREECRWLKSQKEAV